MKKAVLKIVLAGTAVIAATTGVYAYSVFDKTTQALEKIGTPEIVPVEQSAKVKPLTFLLMGIDYREDSGSLNSDVIMVVTLNPENDSATLVSLPRDLQMAPKGLPSRKANYYYPYFNNTDKKNAFTETKKVFSDFMGVPVDYMVTIDFEGFRRVVDLMGGLTLNVDMDMRYVDDEDGTDINLKKGIAKLNGKQTLDFVRYRKSNRNTAESSDLARNQRQQQVLDELMNSMKSAGGVAKLGQIIETVGNHMKTDVPSSQIRDLITTYYDISPASVNYIHLDGDWISPYVVVKDEDMEQARLALRQQLGDTSTAVAGIGGSTGTGPYGSGGITETNSATVTGKGTYGANGLDSERQNETDRSKSGSGSSTGSAKDKGAGQSTSGTGKDASAGKGTNGSASGSAGAGSAAGSGVEGAARTGADADGAVGSGTGRAAGAGTGGTAGTRDDTDGAANAGGSVTDATYGSGKLQGNELQGNGTAPRTPDISTPSHDPSPRP
ncbi:LCP family protein [Paenibacillus piri]|uniref:LytR family transcriptional regulator n=1 Tax=Paenibacillus piri TaxID=2547395 RepID=A0A4R5KII0_9BACL|nr:LCP family protein [Paenibacillus piri]TDF94070.1 LytR family transcriptional regulator [Paenibacillus piri]